MTASHPLLVALNRFGFGCRGAAALYLTGGKGDPRAFVQAELDRPPAPPKGLQTTAQIFQAFTAEQEALRVARAAQAEAPAAPVASDAARPATPPAPQPPNIAQQTYRDEAQARFRAAIQAPCGIVERLVVFWSNHFAISTAKSGAARAGAGAFEREAIRPHVLGRFADMLRAVEQHPLMLHYLDNQQSIGPGSQAGQRQKRGLNENLAREIMELHTLGVNGGYSQEDVTTLARILTGWTVVGRDGRLGEPGTFAFWPQAHEPGPQSLLGRVYADNGRAQGEAALEDLARRPATATFIATKLARHFIADDPPPALVARLAETFRNTDGNLREVTRTLVNADISWSAPLTKMRSPYEFLIAIARLTGRAPDDPNRILGGLNQLGQPLWTPPGPNGFPDTNAAWASAEGMKLRLDMVAQVSRQLRDMPDPRDLMEEAFGPAMSDATRQSVERAESRQQGLALLLMSPEMQRR